MYAFPSGDWVHFTVESNDLRIGGTPGAVELVPVDRDGNSRPLKQGERLIISSITISVGQTAEVVAIWQDSNGDGVANGYSGNECVYSIYANANNGVPFRSDIGIHCMKRGSGNINKIFISASVASNYTRINLYGVIVNS